MIYRYGILLCLVSFGLTVHGYDNFMTPDIDEGAIGSGYNNSITPGIYEGVIGREAP